MNEKEVINDLLGKAQEGKGCDLKEHFENLSFEDTLKTMYAIELANKEARKTDKTLPKIELWVYQSEPSLLRARLHAPVNTVIAGTISRPILDSTLVTNVTPQRLPGEKILRCRQY